MTNPGFSDNSKMSVNGKKKLRLRKSILRLLYDKGSLSAPELSKNLSVSLPTTFTLLNDLIREGWVDSAGTGISTGGRKPSIYNLSDESLFVISCDMERYRAKMTIYNSHNHPVTPLSYIDTHIDDDNLVEKILKTAEKLTRDYDIPKEKIIGLGVDMPGLVDSEKGINYTIKNPVCQGVRDLLRRKFDGMVYVDNDARMQAFGEYIFGKARDINNAVIINWSWGLGLGMILNGRLYGGTTGFAGEFSHIPMVENGDLCICGKRGCLETAASCNTILKLAREGISEGKISQLTLQFADNPEKLTPDNVISMAKRGDEFSISILNRVGMVFGKGLSYLIQLLNPEIIVLGGPVSKANQFILTPIQQALNKNCLEKILQNTSIVISEIDGHSGLLGTTAMLYQRIFSDAEGYL